VQKSPIKETIIWKRDLDMVDFGEVALSVETAISGLSVSTSYVSILYGVASIGRLHQIIGLFCKRDL